MKLEEFYNTWSDKDQIRIEKDILGAENKYKAISKGLLKKKYHFKFESMLDYGCGYGGFINQFFINNKIQLGIGVDYSTKGIEIANRLYKKEKMLFYSSPNLESSVHINSIPSNIRPNKFDVVSLIDVLEHVPNCLELIISLSEITNLFLIKLPLEKCILDNYNPLKRKSYPSASHYNGHLREFDVNNVHYFIRKLGLTPLHEDYYIYSFRDAYPRQQISFNNLTTLQKVKRIYRLFERSLMILNHIIASIFMPKKLFLRIFGGGGYWCLASFDKQHILVP